MRAGLLVLVVLIHAAAGTAAAHPAPFSYLDVRVDASGVHGSLIVHDFDVAYELGLPAPDALLDPATARAHRARLVALVTERLTLLVDGAPVAIDWGAIDALPDRQSLWLPFRAGDARAARLTVEARLFPYDPLHQTFVNVHEDEMLAYQAIVDTSRPRVDYYAGTTQGAFAIVLVVATALAAVRRRQPALADHLVVGGSLVVMLAGTYWFVERVWPA